MRLKLSSFIGWLSQSTSNPTRFEPGRHLSYLCLVVILLAGLSCNVWWLSKSRAPFGIDSPMHLEAALGQYERIASSGSPLLSLFDKTDINYPPFGHYVACLAMRLWGKYFQVAALSSSFWLLVLVISCYGIGAHFGGPAAGLFSSLLTIFAPSVVGLFRQLYLDVPVTAIAALCVWLLLKTREFTLWRPSIALGATIALGMLTKQQFPIILFLPILGVIISSRKVTRQLLASMLVATLGCSFWYLQDLRATIEFSVNNLGGPAELEGDPVVLSLDGLLYYPGRLLGDHLFLPLAILAGYGIYLAIRSFGWRISPLILWAIGPFAAFTLIRNKDTRYILPIVPAICIIAAIGVISIKKPRLKWSLIASGGIIGLVNLVLLTFPVTDSLLYIPAPLLGPPFVLASNATYSSRPVLSSDPLPDLLRNVVRDAEERGWKRPKVAVVAHTFELNGMLVSALSKYEFPTLIVVGATYPYTSYKSPADIIEADYVLTKDGYFAQEAEAPVSGANVRRFVVSECGPAHPLFRLLGSGDFWDGDKAQVFVLSPSIEKLKVNEARPPEGRLSFGGVTSTASFMPNRAVRPLEPLFITTDWIASDTRSNLQPKFLIGGTRGTPLDSFSRIIAAGRSDDGLVTASVLSAVYYPADAKPGASELVLALTDQKIESPSQGNLIDLGVVEVLPLSSPLDAPAVISAEGGVSQLPDEIRWTPVPSAYAYQLVVFHDGTAIGREEVPDDHILTASITHELPQIPDELRVRSVGLLGNVSNFSRPIRFSPEPRWPIKTAGSD
ncbi:MAG: glycosyltransferase family 39 protein [Candidatus Coatesbacteria bacterium]|nr:glycosyltransferase family 39 protein [Candidatus Coatesbacteria bacterium]